MPKPSFQIAWPRMRVPWQLTTTTVVDWPWAEQNRKCSNMFKGGKMGTYRSTIWHKDQGKLVIPRAAHWQTSWEATRGGLGDRLGLFAWEPWVSLQKLLCSVVDKLHSIESAHNPCLHFSHVRLLCIWMLSTLTQKLPSYNCLYLPYVFQNLYQEISLSMALYLAFLSSDVESWLFS